MARPYRLPPIYATAEEHAALEQVARASNRSVSQSVRLIVGDGVQSFLSVVKLGADQSEASK